MTKQRTVCKSCGRSDFSLVSFPCPSDGCSGRIVRCKACKENENPYKCSECGFTGP